MRLNVDGKFYNRGWSSSLPVASMVQIVASLVLQNRANRKASQSGMAPRVKHSQVEITLCRRRRASATRGARSQMEATKMTKVGRRKESVAAVNVGL